MTYSGHAVKWNQYWRVRLRLWRNRKKVNPYLPKGYVQPPGQP